MRRVVFVHRESISAVGMYSQKAWCVGRSGARICLKVIDRRGVEVQ